MTAQTNDRDIMDLATFESLHHTLKSHTALNKGFKIDEVLKPRSFHVIVQDASKPRVSHHVVIYPCEIEGMIVRKSWTHDHDVGIETPIQGRATPDRVLDQIEHWLKF
jgi:hypothetical protein